jgi:CubicO group peptidase (beta-lactamase class C family)
MKKLLFALSLVFFIMQRSPAQLSADSTRKIDSLFRGYNQHNTSGISVMVIRNGKILYNHAFGLAYIAEKKKAIPRTNYRIASVSKQFTAMAIMILRDQGRLSLEDPLSSFFPALPAYAEKITIRQMLNHTSGLPGYGSSKRSDTLEDRDIPGIIAKQDSTAFPPGSRFSYSNSAYVLLGLIVAGVSGQPFQDFVEQHIFRPLKMHRSRLNVRGSRIPERAYGYNLINGNLLLQDQSTSSYLLGDGGIYSSTHDFYQWDQALYGGKLIKRQSLEEIFTPSSHETPSLAYGYGWNIEQKYGTRRIFHNGGTTGFSSYYVRYPEQRFSVIIFANQNNGLALEPIIQHIEAMFLGGN